MKKSLVLAATLLVAGAPAWADEEIGVTTREQQAVAVTIYNSDLALVKDLRNITVPEGRHTLAFREVSARIKPETALLSGGDLEVLEQNFEYDLLTPTSLLQKYVGREVTMIRRHPTTGEDQAEQARVLSAGDGVVLQVGKRIETEVTGRLVYPDVPDTLRDRPTLTMQVESRAGGQRQVELSYLTGGLSWRADYVAELNAADDQLNLSGWVTLTNESGAHYPQARLQLVAGDVNLVREEMDQGPAKRLALAPALAPRAMAEESMFEYHLYTLGRPTTIGERQKKQVALLAADGVECRKEFLLKGQANYYRYQMGEIGRKLKVGVFVELNNDKQSGLGLPIPGGVVRVYKKDSSGFLQFIGEDRVDHTPENEQIRLKLGDSFDVTADRRQTDFKKSDSVLPKKSLYESAFEIVLKNARKEPVTVKVEEPINGDWEIVSESAPHAKESAQVVSWRIPVEPMGKATLTYRVKVKE